MTVSVRLADVSDAEDIARLTVQLGYDVDAAAVRARLSRIMARHDQRFFVAATDDEVVGWLHALVSEYIEADPFVVIGGLVVDASCRGRGIGRALMAQAEQWAKDQHCSVVRLWSSTPRTAAHRFYERLGYTIIKTQYSFAKPLEGTGSAQLNAFVPRIARRQ